MNVLRKALEAAFSTLHGSLKPASGRSGPQAKGAPTRAADVQPAGEPVESSSLVSADKPFWQPSPVSLTPPSQPPESDIAGSTRSRFERDTPFQPNMLSGWRPQWLAQLARLATGPSQAQPGEQIQAEEARHLTHLMVVSVYQLLQKLASEFNGLVEASRGRITVTGPGELAELESPGPDGERRPYFRCRASTASLSLSVKGHQGMVEFFLLPVEELMMLSQAETSPRLRLALVLSRIGKDLYWSHGGLPIGLGELEVLVRNLFKELVLGTGSRHTDELTAYYLPAGKGERLSQAVDQLIMERQNLVQKIVTQQEEIQKNIARELHDTVIADVMMLKRSLSGDKGLSDAEVVQVLDQITQRLREICHDLSPRDLKDWGLQTVVEDLLQRIEERTGADGILDCDGELPDLPNAVQLHIYRIVQECLNNIEKYAEASRIVVSMRAVSDRFVLCIQDNGKGFRLDEPGPRRAREGGTGMGSIRERAELIRCFFPAHLTVESEPDKGTRTTLEIALVGTFAPPPAPP